jgi:hypothetical protein
MNWVEKSSDVIVRRTSDGKNRVTLVRIEKDGQSWYYTTVGKWSKIDCEYSGVWIDAVYPQSGMIEDAEQIYAAMVPLIGRG